MEQIKRSVVEALKTKYHMKDVPDGEFLEWWRRNHGTGYELEIVEDKPQIRMTYCAYCRAVTPHVVKDATTNQEGTGGDLVCTRCGSQRLGTIQGFDASLM